MNTTSLVSTTASRLRRSGLSGQGVIYNGTSFQSEWAAGDTGYLGFTFNPTGGTSLYGWAQISVAANAQTITLVDYAYDNSGASILTGAVPEPTTTFFVLTGLGAIALRRYRRKV